MPIETGFPAAARAEEYLSALKLERNHFLEQVCSGAKLNRQELDSNFTLRLIPAVEGWDTRTAENDVLQKWGLIESGLVKIPVLTVFPKFGWLAQNGVKNLRIRLEDFGGGDMEALPRFLLGLESREGQEKPMFDERAEFIGYSDILDGEACVGLKCEPGVDAQRGGREMNEVFSVELPKNRELLFDKDGVLRDEKRLAKAAEELGRIVKLNDQDLELAEEAVYTSWLDDFCGTNDLAQAIISGLVIEAEGPKTFLLDGRVSVEISRTQAEDGGVVIAVENITIYPPAERGATPRVLRHIVVPPRKGTAYLGELVVVISPEGKITQWVNRYGTGTDRTIAAEVIDSPDRLALLLAKLG